MNERGKARGSSGSSSSSNEGQIDKFDPGNEEEQQRGKWRDWTNCFMKKYRKYLKKKIFKFVTYYVFFLIYKP